MKAPQVAVLVSFTLVTVALTPIAAHPARPAAVSGVVAAAAPAMAIPDDFAYTAVDVFGASQSAVLGINSVGTLAGWYLDAQGTWRGYVMTGGVATDVFVPDTAAYTVDGTDAYAVNTRGDVVGTFYTDDFQVAHGFRLVNGVYSEEVIDGATSVYVFDINDSGAIVGEYVRADGTWVNFVSGPGGFSTFTEADMSQQTGEDIAWVEATGLNDRGQVVGHLQRADGRMTGFVYTNGKFAEVSYPDSNLMACFFGVSDTGEAVGHVKLGPVVYGSVWKGRFTALLRFRDPLGTQAPGTYLQAMSPSGLIGGYYMLAGQAHAFVARRLTR